MRRLLLSLVVLFAVAAPAAAMAATTNAPPGNSAIDEYLETVPGATGNERPRAPAAGDDDVLTAAQQARLERLGPDGKALAILVQETSPATAKLHAGAATAATAEGRSPLSEVLDAATGGGGDSGGMGVALPAILLASLLGCVALVVLRRRSVS
jgi:hypothetical protein